jgi:integrase/recombinase XerD
MKAYLDPEEVKLLEEATSNLRDRLLVRLLFRLGCRVSEALALRVEDIDFTHGTVTIEHLKLRIKLSCPHCSARLSKAHAFCPRCGASVEETIFKERDHRRIRRLPLDSETLSLLRDYITETGKAARDGDTSVFGINRHRAWQVVRECADRAGIGFLVNPETGRARGVSPHRLRDSFAVHAMRTDDSGDGLRLLQEHLGHASFDTTARYRKVAGEEHRKWYERLWRKNRE